MRWTEHGRWFSGRIVRRLTEDVVIKGRRLPATPAAPRWLVAIARGDHAAHPPEAVRDAEPAPGPQPDLFARDPD